MKKRLLNSLILLVSFFCMSANASNKIDYWQAQNNVPVYFVAKEGIPMVDVAVVFSAGSARDAKQWGLASLTAVMLGEGTATKNADEIANAFGSIGAEFSANAGRDFATVHLRTMTEKQYFDPAVSLYSEILSKTRFDSAAVNRVKKQVISGIKFDAQDPENVAEKALYQTIYGDQPYGHPVSGTEETVAALTQADIMRFYQQFYVNGNAKIVIVGDLAKSDAESLANKIAVSLRGGEQAAPIPVAKQVAENANKAITLKTAQTAVLIGELGPDYTDPMYFDLLVANSILGGPSLSSLLMKEVRDNNGYTYGVYSDFSRLVGKGLFKINLKVRAEKAQAAKELTVDVLKQYWQEGPTQHQLDDAKAHLIGAFPIKIASNSAVLANVELIAAVGLPLDYLEQYTARINAVTVASAKKAFQSAVDTAQLDTVVVGHQ